MANPPSSYLIIDASHVPKKKRNDSGYLAWHDSCRWSRITNRLVRFNLLCENTKNNKHLCWLNLTSRIGQIRPINCKKKCGTWVGAGTGYAWQEAGQENAAAWHEKCISKRRA